MGLADLVSREEPDNKKKPARLFFCGDINAALTQTLAERLEGRAVIASPAVNARRAGFLAELAWARWQRGEADDAASLAPMYLPHLADSR
jgi:hypothetical protein